MVASKLGNGLQALHAGEDGDDREREDRGQPVDSPLGKRTSGRVASASTKDNGSVILVLRFSPKETHPIPRFFSTPTEKQPWGQC